MRIHSAGLTVIVNPAIQGILVIKLAVGIAGYFNRAVTYVHRLSNQGAKAGKLTRIRADHKGRGANRDGINITQAVGVGYREAACGNFTVSSSIGAGRRSRP